MQVQVAYGRTGLAIEVPSGTDIIQSTQLPGVTSEKAALEQALRSPIESAPLADRVDPSSHVVIVHTDITRATPNDRILPVVLDELLDAGVPRTHITLVNALGTHRPQTESEHRALVGDAVYENFRCLQHDAFDDDLLVDMGRTSNGHPVRLHHLLVDSDLCILTGFIEPHFFAGFSGGPKGVLPSLAGFESVLSNHGRRMVGSPTATWGSLDGNPIWEEMKEVALMLDEVFLLNVTLNQQHEITGVFAGDLLTAHRKGTDFVRRHSMVPVGEPYDIVVSCNSGYPLDQNLYQCVKGMSAASQITRSDGHIVMAVACADGIPDHGKYAELLRRGGSPDGILAMLNEDGFEEHDQWQVQMQARIQQQADVHVFSNGLTEKQIREALFIPCADVSKTVAQLAVPSNGAAPRICVMPDGPMTIAYVDRDAR